MLSLGTKLKAVRVISRWLAAARRDSGLDVLWFNNLSFYDTWPLSRCARSLGVATIQSYEDDRHELVSDSAISFSRRLFAVNSWLADRYCPRMADAVVVISRYLRRKYEPLCGAHPNVHLVPTIIDCREWSCAPERHTDQPMILYTGSFGEQDEIGGLIEALHILKQTGHRFRAVLLGDNGREPCRLVEARRLAHALGLAGCVEMPGFAPRAEVRRHLEEASILIGIRREGVWSCSGLSTKLSEYLASGRLVIASDVGESSYYLQSGHNALLVPAGAGPDVIARVIGEALNNYDERLRIGRAGKTTAAQFFDLPVAAKQLQSVLNSAMQGRGEP